MRMMITTGIQDSTNLSGRDAVILHIMRLVSREHIIKVLGDNIYNLYILVFGTAVSSSYMLMACRIKL